MLEKHFSRLGRITLCGKLLPFTNIPFTNAVELVTCKKCLKKHAERESKIKGA